MDRTCPDMFSRGGSLKGCFIWTKRNTPMIQTLLCDLILAGARVDASQLPLMLQPLAFPPFFCHGKGRNLSQRESLSTQPFQHGCRRWQNSHDPTQSFGTFCRCWLANRRKLRLRRAHTSASALLAWCTRPFCFWETLEEGKVYEKRLHPLVSWPLFSGGTLRGVQKSGFNENIWQRGCVTWLGLDFT